MASPLIVDAGLGGLVDIDLLVGDGTVAAANDSLPLESSRSGSVFQDRFDASLRWYLPAFTVAGEAGSGFAFAATQSGVTGEGDPFDTAVLIVDVRVAEPPDLAAARLAEPGVTFRQIALDSLVGTLTLISIGAGGSVATPYPTRINRLGAETVRVTVDLQGPSVIVAFQNLRDTAAAVLTVELAHRVWRETRILQWPKRPPDKPPPVKSRPFPWPIEVPYPVDWWEHHPDEPDPVSPKSVHLQVVQPEIVQPGVNEVGHVEVGHVEVGHVEVGDVEVPVERQRALVERVPGTATLPDLTSEFEFAREFDAELIDLDDVPIEVISWIEVTDVETSALALGTMFVSDAFRSRYTLTASGMTRPITDADDLRSFATPRSEYRELTSLGVVADRYPSLRALYFGQVSGTVVAIPARYGIVRSSSGCLARCDAVVDESAASLSGSRFAFTFTVAPVVDPFDLARLRADLPGCPEAQGRSLQVALPSGLDPRTGPVFAGTAVEGTTVVVEGPAPHTFVVGVSITDDGDIPAITGVNLFLQRLVVTTTPITARVAVRLDDEYPTPVTTAVVLGLDTTADSDDLGVTLDPAACAITVTNAGPLDLRLTGVVSIGAAGITQTEIDTPLASTRKTQLPCPTGTTTIAVRRRLDLPDPMTQHAFFDYINLKVQTVQSVQHPLGFNATAINFEAAGIERLDLRLTLDELPGLAVPPLTLTAAHRVDSVHIAVPIGAVVTGLSATVTTTVTTTGGGTRNVELHRDFLADPIALLTPADLT